VQALRRTPEVQLLGDGQERAQVAELYEMPIDSQMRCIGIGRYHRTPIR
jgi:hypothetical protein